MGIQFVNRKMELGLLENFSKGPGGIFVLWGRRRVGKSRLLSQFAAGRESVYLQATKETERGILSGFSQELGRRFDDPALEGASFESFRDMLRYIQRKKGDAPLLLVIDEFPYLCEANGSVPSILQVEYDQGRLAGMHVVLSGSTVSAMESEVLGAKSPLYGRRSGQHKLQPMGAMDAKGFFPSASWEEYLRLYAVAGGTPEYLLRMDEGKGWKENVLSNIAAPGSMLLDEPELLFKTEVREPRTYFSIMKAMSQGRSTPNEIATLVGMPRTSIVRYLEMLEKLDLVHRRVPVTEPAISRRGRYRIRDNFFRFYFRFVFPHLSHVRQGITVGLTDALDKDFNAFMGQAFEMAVEDALVAMARSGRIRFSSLGPWWDGEAEIDLVMRNGRTVTYVECKWSDLDARSAVAVLESLKEKASRVNLPGAEKRYLIAARKCAPVDGAETLTIADMAKLA